MGTNALGGKLARYNNATLTLQDKQGAALEVTSAMALKVTTTPATVGGTPRSDAKNGQPAMYNANALSGLIDGQSLPIQLDINGNAIVVPG
jgi:hypothetical protein